MCFAAVGGLESHGADGAFVKDFAVFLLDVALLSLDAFENHVAVKTPAREGGVHTHTAACFHCS